MIKFLKYTLATFVGGIVAALVLVMMFIAIIAGMATMGDEKVQLNDKTILLLKLNGPIVERATESPFDQLLEGMTDGMTTEGLNQILSNIDKAARDPKISGILLESGLMETGYATVEEIRHALIRFKESGKFVYSFAPVYTQKSYYLASVADKIYLTPGGMVEFKGIHSQHLFFKGTLDKLGIEMQVFKHGKFKSAVEPFVNEKMSDESRHQTEVYIHSIWNHVLMQISKSRNIEIETLKKLADQMIMFQDPSLLVDNQLIDGLKYKDELLSELKTLTGTEEKDDLESVTNKKYAKAYVPGKTVGLAKDKIAVIYAEGEIDGSGSEGIQSENLSKTIRKARRDSSVKAIVLRINSPGGSALGSEIIWREVKLAKETKPLVVSMGDLAASGGYYIACAADTILAHPTTLTGSIGIFGIIPNAKELFNNIGITFDGAKTNEFADMPALERPFTSREKDILQAYIERGYQLFVSRCAEGRKTSGESIDSVGQGRVWTGENATSINLVDKLGGIGMAIETAARMAGVEEYRTVELPELEDPFTQLFKEMGGEASAFMRKSLFGEEIKYFDAVKHMKNAYPVQARVPYQILVD